MIFKHLEGDSLTLGELQLITLAVSRFIGKNPIYLVPKKQVPSVFAVAHSKEIARGQKSNVVLDAVIFVRVNKAFYPLRPSLYFNISNKI